MKKALKILKIVGITLGVIIILLIVVPFFIPADTYKKLIVEQAEKQVSGKIEIGSMRLRILPWPGFILRDIKVSNNADTFKDQTIVAAGKIAIDLQLKPLLDKMVVASLELIKPEVYFRTAKDGHTNIDDLLKKPVTSNQKPEGSASMETQPNSGYWQLESGFLIKNAWADDAEKPVEPSTEGPKSALATGWQPMLGGFIIDDALLEMWEEGQEKPTQQVKHLDLEIAEFSPLKEEAKTKFSFAAAVLGQEDQNVFIKGGLTLRMEKQEAEVNNWVITIGKADFNLNASAEYGKQPPAFKATLVGTSFTLDELLAFDPSQKKSLPPDVKLDGPMSLNVDVAGTPENVSLNTNVSLTSAGVAYADMFTKPKGTAMKLDLKGHYTPAKVTIKPLTLTLGETVFNIDGYANMDVTKNGELAIDTRAIKIGELATMTPMLATATGVSDPSIHIDIKGPFTDPTKLNISGHVTSKKIVYADYEMDNLDTKFSYADNKANLDSLTAIIYEGNLDGKAQVILTDEPQYSSDVLINKVNLSKIKAIEGLIVGKGSVKVDITGKGADPEVAKKNLNGQGYIHLEEGEIPKLNVGQKVFGHDSWNKLGALAGFSGVALKTLQAIDARVEDLKINYTIVNGVIETPDVNYKHSKYKLHAGGTVDLDQNLNYSGEFILYKDETDGLVSNATAKKYLTNGQGELVIPFILKGTVSDPQFLPDGEHMASLFAKVAAQVVADVATQKAKDEAKNLLQQKLQNQAKPSSVPKPKVDIKQGGKDLKKAFGF